MNEELDQAKNEETPETMDTSTRLTIVDESNEELHASVLDEHDHDHPIDGSDLEGMTLQQLVDEANKTLLLSPKQGLTRMEFIRSSFDALFVESKNEAESNAREENPEVDFSFEHEPLSTQMDEVEATLHQAEKEEKQRIEDEKKNNLKAKEDLLKQLEVLTESDETSESIAQVKEIQRQWKTIRALPQSEVSRLWEQYHNLLDKFYDNHGINIELKELDRRKNLEIKIELTKKVEELAKESSLKRSFIMLNKYHEEFKNVGSVPKESREAIWKAFKTASDAIYDQKRKQYESMEASKEENLRKKELLLEKARVIDAVDARNPKDWNTKTEQLDALFAEWKTIGPVPKSNKDEVWINFNGLRNDFYQRRKAFHKEQNKHRKANLEAKEALCIRVESLKDNSDWKKTAQEIKTIQAEWKKIGPVPDKVNQAIWKRFRAACDHFFDARNKQFEGKKKEEENNLTAKEELIKRLNGILESSTDHKEALGALREGANEWKSIGYVPHKAVKRINTAYEKVSNAIYKKFKEEADQHKAKNLKSHYKDLAKGPSGDERLNKELRFLKKRMTQAKEEITSIETNMSFFSMSSTANDLLKDFEAKIDKLNKQVDRLKSEMSVIKAIKRSSQQAADEQSAENA